MRPLLPTIPEEELERIVILTKKHSDGYYSGPLYLKELDESVIGGNALKTLHVERLQPHWMPDENLFYKIEKEGQMDFLKSIIERNQKLFFEGAAEGIKHFRQQRLSL